MKTSLEKYTSHFICKVCVCVRRSWRPNRTAIYWPPLLWPSALCPSCSLGLLNWRPSPWVQAFSTASCHQRVSKLTNFLSSPSYIIAHSIFGMACLIVIKRIQLSCSSQFTFFQCISLWLYHGILPCPILSAKPTYTISSHNCHWNVSLPSGASLWNGMFGRVEGQYTTIWKVFNQAGTIS